MTLVAIWHNPSHAQLPGIWCATDGRVISEGSTLTERYLKVLPLRVRCLDADGVVYAERTLGVAFAGNALVSSLWYGIAQEACWELEPVAPELAARRFQPNLTQMARLLEPPLLGATKNVGAIIMRRAAAMVALFGEDEGSPTVVTLKSEIDHEVSVKIERFVLKQPFRMGSGRESFDREMSSQQAGDLLAPARAVLGVARSGEAAHESVGGVVSIGVLTQADFVRAVAVTGHQDRPIDQVQQLGVGAIQYRQRVIRLNLDAEE